MSFYYVSKNETGREGDIKANPKNQPPGLVQNRNQVLCWCSVSSIFQI